MSKRSSSSAITSRTCSESNPRSATRSLGERRLDRTAADVLEHVDHAVFDRRRGRLRHAEASVRIASGASGNDNDRRRGHNRRCQRCVDSRCCCVLLSSLLTRRRSPRRSIRARRCSNARRWDALDAGQARAAADAFREALAADPKNARLHLGAGMAASLERRDADARDEFERALALDPKLAQARALLGQIQYRMGDVRSARSAPTRRWSPSARRPRRARDARALAARGRAARSHAAGGRRRISPSRSKARRSRARGRGARGRSTAPTGASASCSARYPVRPDRRSCSTRPSSSATSRARRRGPRAPTTAHPRADARRARQARGARSRARRTSSRTRSSARSPRAACRRG